MPNFSKQEFEKQYNEIKSIYSPFFDENILFGLDGWSHLLKSKGVPRAEEEFLARFKLLDIGCELLKKNFPPTEYSRRDYDNNYSVEFYSFIYAYQHQNGEEFRIKMVIREKPNKPKHFFSLIKMKHNRFQNKETP
jgi:hypothetical protein